MKWSPIIPTLVPIPTLVRSDRHQTPNNNNTKKNVLRSSASRVVKSEYNGAAAIDQLFKAQRIADGERKAGVRVRKLS